MRFKGSIDTRGRTAMVGHRAYYGGWKGIPADLWALWNLFDDPVAIGDRHTYIRYLFRLENYRVQEHP